MREILLELRDVTIGYGPVKVVRGISVLVRRGEIVTVLGPNGAGKTTLVKAVVGLLPITNGDIFFEETKITGIKAHLMASLGVALVPEGRGVFPKMSVEENLKAGYCFLKKNASFCNPPLSVITKLQFCNNQIISK